MALSKEEIKKNVVDQLFWDARVDASEISIDFSDGTVVLTGSVPTFLARQAAEQDVWAVPGVSAVRNDIAVRFPSGHQIPSDEEIKSAIANLLTWDPNVENKDILVTVENGVVTLDGSVPAYFQKVRTEELVVDVNGVTYLHSRLTVVPEMHYVDELIARDIIAALDRNANLNVNNIEVQVNNGQVVLSGYVSDRASLQAAENSAKNTDGVTEVLNNLLIG